ncbi:MAG: hypothetical protein ACOXZ4_01775 [Sphaerochaetaceae bacterium]
MNTPFLKLFATLFLCICCTSCEAQPQKELINALLGKDCRSPVLLQTRTVSPTTVQFEFDEMVFCSTRDFTTNTSNSVIGASVYENSITITFAHPVAPGKQIAISARVADRVGNSLSFTVGIWGYNDAIPPILINEFTTKGSGNNPDRVELLILGKGNLAGITLYDGLKESFDSQLILPFYEVEANTYVVIEYGEQLRGAHTIEFWGGEVNLGANNGVLSLYDNPEGSLLDAVLYSNRTSASDTQYGGFGTKKVQQRALLLEQSGHWGPLPITPECGIDSTYSTATRSMCRFSNPVDTNSKADWHIVPTSKASFGMINTDEEYQM